MTKGKWMIVAAAALLPLCLMLAGCRTDDDADDDPPQAASFELAYATYWGGWPNANKGNAIAVDAAGDIYLAGETQSQAFPLKNPIVDTIHSTQGFISRFAADGQSVVYSSYLGDPNGYNICQAMAVDLQGNAVAGGLAGGKNFPLRNPLFPTFGPPWQCGFLSSVAHPGGALNFSTFIPDERVIALDVGLEGDVYLATWDNTIRKISADGRRLLYQYHAAGADDTEITDIAVMADGSLAVAGWTAAGDYFDDRPLGNGGLYDAFIFVLNPQGDAMTWKARIGGSQDDGANGVAVGADGSLYVCGSTTSLDFPTQRAAQAASGGDRDGFVARIDPGKRSLVYATYLGGSGEDWAKALALNAASAAYVTGYTTSSDFPLRRALQGQLGGVKDAFVAKLGADGLLAVSTFIGGKVSSSYLGASSQGADWANAICLGPEGKVYITGETYSRDFPLKNPLDTANEFSKAFIVMLAERQQ